MNLFFEGDSADTAILTNWHYTGGTAAGYSKMVANGVTVGSSRQDLLSADPAAYSTGDEVAALSLQFFLDGDTVTWFGVIDCAFEGA